MQTAIIKPEVQQFTELFQRGKQCWIEAGEIIAREVDKDPLFIDEVCAACPDITPECVMRFYDLGKKRLHPELLVSSSPGCKMLARLPYDLQAKYIKEPIPLLICNDGTWETLPVDVRNLTTSQAKQAINCENVRTQAAQRTWIEDKRAKKSAPSPAVEASFKVQGGKVIFKRDVTITRKELAQILASME